MDLIPVREAAADLRLLCSPPTGRELDAARDLGLSVFTRRVRLSNGTEVAEAFLNRAELRELLEAQKETKPVSENNTPTPSASKAYRQRQQIRFDMNAGGYTRQGISYSGGRWCLTLKNGRKLFAWSEKKIRALHRGYKAQGVTVDARPKALTLPPAPMPPPTISTPLSTRAAAVSLGFALVLTFLIASGLVLYFAS